MIWIYLTLTGVWFVASLLAGMHVMTSTSEWSKRRRASVGHMTALNWSLVLSLALFSGGMGALLWAALFCTA